MDEQEVRLIDANALYKKLEHRYRFSSKGARMAYGLAIDDVCDAPTIDPESMRPHGKWIKGPKREDGLYHIMCSKCKTDAHFSYFYEEDYDGELSGYAELLEYPSEYCPNCGAKMEDRNHD